MCEVSHLVVDKRGFRVIVWSNQGSYPRVRWCVLDILERNDHDRIFDAGEGRVLGVKSVMYIGEVGLPWAASSLPC